MHSKVKSSKNQIILLTFPGEKVQFEQKWLNVYVTAGRHANVCDGRVFPPPTCFLIYFYLSSVRPFWQLCVCAEFSAWCVCVCARAEFVLYIWKRCYSFVAAPAYFLCCFDLFILVFFPHVYKITQTTCLNCLNHFLKNIWETWLAVRLHTTMSLPSK